MAGRTLFNFRVLRCPSCNATLPVGADDVIVICEYCEARVQVAGSRTPAAAAPTATTPPPFAGAREPAQVLVAKPHASAFAWILFVLVITVSSGGVFFATLASTVERSGLGGPLSADESSLSSSTVAEASRPTTEPTPPPGKTEEPVSEGASEPDDPSDAAPPKTETKPKVVAGPRKPKLPEPTGPVLPVSDAQKAIESNILACMREQKVHDILAYMGNSKVGAVSVLGDSRTRVDGVRKKIKGSKLGACMDRAGATVRVRAFKSNYLRFSLVNDSLPDPLGHLPAKSDRAEIDRIIATADPQVLECAKKHGEEGAKEIFMFTIDGPSGTPTTVNAGYRGRAFKRCAEPIYKKLRFPKVREWTIKVTKHLQM